MKAEDVLSSMDENGDGTIDLHEWTDCMTKELRMAIYRQLNNKDKLEGFRPLVDVAKVKAEYINSKFYNRICCFKKRFEAF